MQPLQVQQNRMKATNLKSDHKLLATPQAPLRPTVTSICNPHSQVSFCPLYLPSTPMTLSL